MKNYIFILCVLFAVSCDKSDACKIGKTLPVCIEEIISNPDKSGKIQTVQVQKINGENHYWLNTNDRFFDGTEYIINSCCDTICSFCGFCVAPDCFKKYSQTWDTIWVK